MKETFRKHLGRPFHPASGRVMEKCGFVNTGMLNKCSQLVGGDKDMVKVFKYKGLKNEKEIKSNG